MMEFLELILHDLLVTRAILWGCRHNFTGASLPFTLHKEFELQCTEIFRELTKVSIMINNERTGSRCRTTKLILSHQSGDWRDDRFRSGMGRQL